MSRLVTYCFAGLVVVSVLSERAMALSMLTPVTPASIKEKDSKFSVTAEKNKDGQIQFKITYRLSAPQYLVAHFELRDGERILTKTDTPCFARETSATYYVAVSPNQLADARFELSQNGFSESDRQPVALPGGTISQIDLQAFGKSTSEVKRD